MKLPTKIPKRFWNYFWDVDAAKINPSEKPYFVVQRMLDKGNDETVRWVTKNFPRKIIAETFKKLRDFSPRIGNFWQLTLSLPQNQVACLQPHYLKMRKELWPY